MYFFFLDRCGLWLSPGTASVLQIGLYTAYNFFSPRVSI
jgi:hypothetical protein